MSNIRSTTKNQQSAHQAIILPFKTQARTKAQFHPCIFCGKTMRVHNFKGKTVCIHCLRQIPAIFSFG
ncbi:hypothetical protein [Desulfosporosinus sp. BICA1-9]|uniref:hypothetical protein n=1 Tax=Desulfosporosinus sp. BICA1-9 TaxID=1531958 RepID=UPI00054B42D2|nr:hypothetical protein [Desulfosporosinus sp. BICA1-9]KJS47182.1 MAG: hypothetical protein VR66_20990 [Peptococcaceae bacterium BRH_c23]KJS89994.1 MAG: hypothetical protein JL57_03990 [Desulfosporosinus sp. BICA1-9]HBW36475.1 hypothetical protein [Desulfosporosinus sp.]